MMELLLFIPIVGLALFPVAIVFTVLFATFKLAFKLGFWILQLAAAAVLWSVVGGGLLVFLGLMLLFNLVCIPLFFVLCSR